MRKRQRKPDYDHIASMELDIFGETWVPLEYLSLQMRNRLVLEDHFRRRRQLRKKVYA